MGITAQHHTFDPDRRRGVSIARRSALAIAVASIVSATLGMAGCSKAPEADPRTEPVVVVTSAAAPTGETARQFSGVVAARVQSNLGFRVNGKVIERLVDVGQTVKREQPLMKIDPVDLD